MASSPLKNVGYVSNEPVFTEILHLENVLHVSSQSAENVATAGSRVRAEFKLEHNL